DLLARAGARGRWVGHPAGALRPEPERRDAAKAELGLAAHERLVALLPGSRSEEVGRHLGPMLDAAARLTNHMGGRVRAAVSDAGAVLPALRRDASARLLWDALRPIHARGEARDLLRAADVAVVASGTATLETAALGVPQVIV